jgi:2-ketoarginine methyltransferase
MKMLRQIWNVIRLVGLPRAIRMKKRHEQGLVPLRGHVATRCFWTLLQCGLWDQVQATGRVDIEAFAGGKGLDVQTLHAICKYLDGISWVRLTGKTLEPAGPVKTLLEEPRGLYELGYAYEPVMNALDDLVAGRAVFGRDVQRRTDWVGIGSGRLCQQLPYPVLGDLVARYGGKRVIDLGCGDGAFAIWMLEHIADLQVTGLDLDGPTADLARRRIEESHLALRASVVCGDMFDLVRVGGSPPALPDLSKADTITVCDTFHEYLWNGEQPIVEFLRALKARRPGITVVMGDFCVQDESWLRQHPIASLEHHLWHDLTRQRLISEAQWRQVFDQAGMQVVDSRVFDIVGHGYFVLR